jgi:hypothetical protein
MASAKRIRSNSHSISKSLTQHPHSSSIDRQQTLTSVAVPDLLSKAVADNQGNPKITMEAINRMWLMKKLI